MPAKGQENFPMHGYLVDDSVIYELVINNHSVDYDKALEIMKNWLDQF